MFSALRSYSFKLRQHPIVGRNRLGFVRRVVGWQLASRLLDGPAVVPCVNDCRLLLRHGQTGATVQYYAGLYEFEDMLFVAHALGRGDLFVDVGANVGAYAVLAAGVAGAHVLAIEPVPKTFECLIDNIQLNRLGALVTARNVGAGRSDGVLRFSIDRAAENHVLPTGAAGAGMDITVTSLDALLAEGGWISDGALVLKIDVEGWETEVVAGATETLALRQPTALLIEMNRSGMRYGFSETDLHVRILDLGLEQVIYDPMTRRLEAGASKGTVNRLYVSDIPFFEGRVADARPVRVQKSQF